jgi:aminoglycoside phosphotransferase (APT) family kinase protein
MSSTCIPPHPGGDQGCDISVQRALAVPQPQIVAIQVGSAGGRERASVVVKVKRESLPALERLHQALRERKPEPCPKVTLVHGDAKPGNFAFIDGDVSAVFDWEMTTVGDPLTDIGWLEMLWIQPVGINSHPAALTIDALLGHYQAASGIKVQNRSWYRAFNAYKMAVICLIGAMLVDDGHSEDQKLVLAAYGTPLMTKVGLAELGIDEPLDDGPVLPREERIQQVLAHAK